MSAPSWRRLRASAAHLQQPSAAATDELTPEELAAWRRNGCLIVRQLFTGAPLERLQEAFAAQQAETRAEWAARMEDSWHAEGYFDLHRPLELQTPSTRALSPPYARHTIRPAPWVRSNVIVLLMMFSR